MGGDPRVFDLLEEVLDSGRTPEEVCRDCPELLPEVRERWRRFGLVDAELRAMFPDPGATLGYTLAGSGPSELPRIPGYEVEAVLGHGGMGVVYRARHLRLNRPVALKMLLTGPFAQPVERERFLREAEAVAGLGHPNVVQVYDSGEFDSRPYFTMELMEGGTLSRKLGGTPLPARAAAGLVAALSDAVGAAHAAGIIHRDLKPSNVLLAADGTPKVADFGLARRVDGGPGLTRTGAAVGTPSYMAPEQARGDTKAVGPAADVYALGAFLYECLTGRPPFKAESALETLQQVIAQDPVPPSRLNARVPRDLETVCLKCLHKEPHRRYASARALAEDLRHFERGEPIKARPVGPVERAVRSVRRRPALAAALAAGVLLAAALMVTVVWWSGQRAALAATSVAYAEADLDESERLRDLGGFQASAAVLQRAKDRLGGFVPPKLRDRLQAAFENLELVKRLDAIRLERALLQPGASLQDALVVSTPGPLNDPHRRPGGVAPDRRYEEVFRSAGLGALRDDPAETAARVQASPVRAALVAALDDWAACETGRDRQAWILTVARRADPDPWRDRFRNTGTWDDPEALRQLATEAPAARPSPQLLAQLGARLRAKGVDAEAFLTRAVASHPDDFWVNVEAGNALVRSKPVEAIGYYRTAVALRPETGALHHALGLLYYQQKRWDECLAHHRHAVRLAPDDGWSRTGLGAALAELGCFDEAKTEYREAIRLGPDNPWPHHNLALLLQHRGEFDEAVDHHRQAARLFSDHFANMEKQYLRNALLKLGRHAEACALWEEQLAGKPSEHDAWFGYAELCLFLGDEAGYRRARRDLLAQFGSATDPTVAERTGRACLLLPASDDELRQAVALTGRAVAAGRPGRESAYPFYRFAEGLARYRQGRFDDAVRLMTGEAASVMGPSPGLVLAMAQHRQGQKDRARKTLAATTSAWDWSVSKAEHNGVWIAHVLRREAEALIGAVRPEPGPVPRPAPAASPASVTPGPR